MRYGGLLGGIFKTQSEQVAKVKVRTLWESIGCCSSLPETIRQKNKNWGDLLAAVKLRMKDGE
jgi:hypothetical protein